MPMTPRQYATLASEIARTATPKVRLGGRAALHDLHAEAYNTFGDLDRLRPLKATTQAQRAAMGYPPNEPLLLTGGERDTLGMSVMDTPEGVLGNVGSDDKRLFFQELGTIHMEPIPLLSVATYISAARYDVIMLLVAESMCEGVRGLAAMENLLALEMSRDIRTPASTE
jgi:hypothetical protein